MKRVYFVILSVFSVLTISAQDIIYKTNGDSIVAKVLGTNHGKIKYANWENETVYIKSIPQGKVISISYENEKGDSFFAPRIGIQGTKFDSQDALLTRKGNHYYYNGVKMNQREYGDFLAMNSQPAYQRFKDGYRKSNYGWALLGAGCAMNIIGVSLLYTRDPSFHSRINNINIETIDDHIYIGDPIYIDTTPHYYDYYYNDHYDRNNRKYKVLSHGLFFIGSILQIASIPIISVGYSDMHRSVDIYNVEKIKKYQPSLSVKGGVNGIGVALNF